MQSIALHSDSNPPKRRLAFPSSPHLVRTILRVCALAALASGATLVGTAQTGVNPCKPIHDPVLTALPDANKQMELRQQQTATKDFAAANIERKKQISDDSAKLLKLATELKGEVDKTTKDTLSLGVIHKADEIEKLAHDLKEKMKLTVGGS
jgi:hypothetical protein